MRRTLTVVIMLSAVMLPLGASQPVPPETRATLHRWHGDLRIAAADARAQLADLCRSYRDDMPADSRWRRLDCPSRQEGGGTAFLSDYNAVFSQLYYRER